MGEVNCSIPDDHIDPRRSAFFMARSILREAWEDFTGSIHSSDL